jgi:hypothetical protein
MSDSLLIFLVVVGASLALALPFWGGLVLLGAIAQSLNTFSGVFLLVLTVLGALAIFGEVA